MRYFIFLIVLLTGSICLGGPSVKKRVLPFYEVINQADLIVHGTIIKTEPSSYDLKIKVYLKGKEAWQIKVNQWKEWICDKRNGKPYVGEELLLFLSRDEQRNYNIINGSTGELQIKNNGEVHSNMLWQIKELKLAEVKLGIQYFLECFKRDLKLRKWKLQVATGTLQEYKSKNRFLKLVVSRMPSTK